MGTMVQGHMWHRWMYIRTYTSYRCYRAHIINKHSDRFDPIMLLKLAYYAFEQCSKIKPIMLSDKVKFESKILVDFHSLSNLTLYNN